MGMQRSTRRTTWLWTGAWLACAWGGACNSDDASPAAGGTATSGESDSETGAGQLTAATDSASGPTQTEPDTQVETETETETDLAPPAGPGPHAFRIDKLAILDPHVFFMAPIIGCHDFVANGLLTYGSLNEQLTDAITMDLGPNEMPDGILDLSIVLVFRPYDDQPMSEVDVVFADCTSPLDQTSCTPIMGQDVTTTPVQRPTGSSCLAPRAADLNPKYMPTPVGPEAPCFVAGPVDLNLQVQGISIPLSSAQISATPAGMATTDGFTQGLIRGFLSETTAATSMLPMSLPVVGGAPMADLLPGSPNNCSPDDDRDQNGSERGWWFYLSFEASLVAYED